MTTATLTDELRRVLWACLTYWDSEPVPPEDRAVCYSWVEGVFAEKFGATFHQSRLAALSELGLLVPDTSARGGGRRYYRIADAAATRELVAGL